MARSEPQRTPAITQPDRSELAHVPDGVHDLSKRRAERPAPGPPAPTAAQLRAALTFARCMRTHGLPGFRDPLATYGPGLTMGKGSTSPSTAPPISSRPRRRSGRQQRPAECQVPLRFAVTSPAEQHEAGQCRHQLTAVQAAPKDCAWTAKSKGSTPNRRCPKRPSRPASRSTHHHDPHPQIRPSPAANTPNRGLPPAAESPVVRRPPRYPMKGSAQDSAEPARAVRTP